VNAQFGEKKLVVITGTSSGLGRKTAKALLETGDYHVVGAVRDLDKMEAVAEIDGFDPASFTPMHVELTSFESVRNFCDELKEWKGAKPLDRLICNAAVYQPSLPVPKWTVDGHEQQMQINFLSQFLLLSKLLPDLTASDDPRVILVGSVTGNDNTVGGGGVYPIADLKSLDGLRQGARRPVAMFDGYEFDGAKAYKDSKLCLMMMSHLLHVKYHKQTGIAFSSIYPGCIAESPLFREKRAWCAAAPNGAEERPPPLSGALTAPLPPAPSQVPQVLPRLHEVHHRRLRLGDRGGDAADAGGARPALLQVGRVLVVERRPARGARGGARDGRPDLGGGRRRRRLGLDLRERPVEQGARHRARRRPLPALDAGDGR
jgi:light-dependent protochlorophyllide reductase